MKHTLTGIVTLTLLASSMAMAAYPTKYWEVTQETDSMDFILNDLGASTKMVINDTGNVGIGTVAPAYTLDVDAGSGFGMGLTSGSQNYGIILNGNQTGAQSWGVFATQGGATEGDGNLIIKNFSGDLNAVTINQSGSMGISTTTPSAKLHVVGDVLANFYNTTSDATLKKHLAPINNADKLLNLSGYYFDWKDTGEAGMGLMAQEVETQFPLAVTTLDSGIKTVDYTKLIAPMLEMLKAQQAEIEELKGALN